MRKVTDGMTAKKKLEYVFTYYWYHMLGVAAAAGLAVFLVVHFAFPDQKPEFTCALVNQKTDTDRDQRLEEALAGISGLSQERIVFDSAYLVHYEVTGDEETQAEEAPGGETRLSSYESGLDKLLFQWSQGELDAVIMTEDFMNYCIDTAGGQFYSLEDFDIGDLTVYEAGGYSAVRVKGTGIEGELDETEDLVIAFPDTGRHKENCQSFIDLLKG